MAPKAPALKQGTLSFASSKRGAPATTAGKANVLRASPSAATEKKPTGVRTVSSDSTISLSTTSMSAASDDDVVMFSSSSTAPTHRGVKRLKTASGAPKAVGSRIKRKAPAGDSSTDEEPEVTIGDLGALEKSGRLNKIYAQSRERMGGLPPIHAEKQTKVHHILRIFDTSYEYGPCVGMTRLERWERARALGLNPPAEIRDILMTEQASKDDTYKQSVFYGDV